MARQLPKRHHGEERCQTLNGGGRICVYGAKYVWSAWLVNAAGQKIAPISIGKATGASSALRAAVANAQRIRNGLPQRHRKGRR